MLLRVLGPLEVAPGSGRPMTGASKPRVLLLALAARRGQVQSSDELGDALWGEAPPASAAKLLQVYVSQLRRALPTGVVIRTKAPGYVLEAADEDFDAAVFERTVFEGRTAAREGNPRLAAATLRRALDLWRGPAYADVRYEEFAREEVERLESLRAGALAERIEADLQLGRHAEILAELRGLLAGDPTNERLAAQASLAAYRSGGPSDALAIIETTRRALDVELGEGPGRELTDLAARIAHADPTLAAPAPASDVAAALPAAPNALVGRERELVEVRRLVERPGVRLVSLTGAGGSGKSRLALELAAELADRFANGVALVELASFRDPGLVFPTIARAVGVDPGPDPLGAVAGALSRRQVLLVLDNFEHLRDAAPDLVRLLAAAPLVVVLVTTRVVLHVSGEHVYPVGPLDDNAAIELFAERAHARDPAFTLDAATRPPVAGIVERLDRLPLPIELAAARVRSLGLQGLDARLASRLGVLTGGPRDLPARQQTLRETLAWSVKLLDPGHATVLARLGVFPGGSSTSAASVVADADDDALATLVDHHLVQALDVDGERRFRLLETVREYALELLDAGDDATPTFTRLVHWCLAVAERAEPALSGDGQTAAMATLDAEHDNLRAALAAAGRLGLTRVRLRMAVALSRFWYVRGYLVEARGWLEAALDHATDDEPQLRRRGLTAAAAIALIQGDYDAATTYSEQSLDIARALGEDRLIANGLSNLGAIVLAAGDRIRARTLLEEAVTRARAGDDERVAAMAVNNLGDLALTEGDYNGAMPLFEESLAVLRARGDTANVARSLFNIGAAALMTGRLGEARTRFAESLVLGREAGDKEDLAWCLLGMAGVVVAHGDGERAARLVGAAVGLVEAFGAALKPFERHLFRTADDEARRVLGEQAYLAARSTGASLSIEEALALAREASEEPAPVRPG